MVRQKKRTSIRKGYTRMSQQSPIQAQTFQLIMARFDNMEKQNKERFDTLEDQNKEQTRIMSEHVKTDNTVHDVVTKHTNYWNMVKWLLGPTGIGVVLALIALFFK